MSWAQFDKFPYAKVVLKNNFEAYPDPFLSTLLECGIIKNDSEIKSRIASGSNTFSARYYNPLSATQNAMQVYNGKDDVKFNRVDGGTYQWCVFGRMQGFEALQFTDDFTGTNQMDYIVKELGKYRTKERQALLIKMLKGIFDVQTDEGWKLHTSDISSSSSSIQPENELDLTSLYNAMEKACGDQADGFKVAVMHSKVASKLSAKKLLEYDKYTKENGVDNLKTATLVNGLKVIVNNNVPTENSSGANKYTTFLFGEDLFGYAPAPVTQPLEFARDPISQGGIDRLIIRFREALVPYGFTWLGDANNDTNTDPKAQTNNVGIPDDELTKSTNYKLYVPHQTIKMARIISN